MSSFNQKAIKRKIALLNLAAELGNVSKACKLKGFSRNTFYRCQKAVAEGGVEALFDASHKKSNLKNRVDEAAENAVAVFAMGFPAYGQARVSNEPSKKGIFVSPSGVRSIWLRHGLESIKLCLVALEKKSAEEGIILTEVQARALEIKKADDDACGEIETCHPGYLGSQGAFYVGTIKGLGCIYHQTFACAWSKWAAANFYTTKMPITAANLLNDHTLPFFAEKGMGVIRILTNMGKEYCGQVETHDYKLYLGLSNIEHAKTKARHPQTNGICGCFHKTILQEFYQPAFRRKFYSSLEELQSDLNA